MTDFLVQKLVKVKKKKNFSSVSTQKLKCPSLARNLYSSARLSSGNSSSNSLLVFWQRTGNLWQNVEVCFFAIGGKVEWFYLIWEINARFVKKLADSLQLIISLILSQTKPSKVLLNACPINDVLTVPTHRSLIKSDTQTTTPSASFDGEIGPLVEKIGKNLYQ